MRNIPSPRLDLLHSHRIDYEIFSEAHQVWFANWIYCNIDMLGEHMMVLREMEAGSDVRNIIVEEV